MGQQKTLRVCPFYDGVSGEFKGQYREFSSEVGQFFPHLFLELRNSKALATRVDTAGESIVERKGFSRIQIVQNCVDSLAAQENREGRRLADFALVGWLSDDTSVVACADAWLFRLREDTLQHTMMYVLESTLHSEGSQRDAYVRGRTLSEYLVQDMVFQVEAAVDDRIRVLVTPFVFHGSTEEFKELGGMIAALVSNRLSISQRIRVVGGDTTQIVRSSAATLPGNEIRKSTLPELGRREAAKYIVGGSYFQQRSAVGIEASHIDRETGHAVLSKSILIDPFSGTNFYEQANLLGDEVRRAIELDYDIKKEEKKITVAVAALPPYPNTRENRKVAVDMAAAVARMFRQIQPKEGWQVIMGSDSARLERFASVETERSVMGRDFNSQYLLMIRCERPVNDFNVSLELADVRKPDSKSPSARSFRIPMTALNDSIHVLMLRLFREQSPLSACLRRVDSTRLSRIVYSPPPTSVAVMPLPPFPNTLENKGITTDIADLVLTKLLALQVQGKLDVVRTEHRYSGFMEQENLNVDSVAADIPARYIWTIDYKELGLNRHVLMHLINATNRFEPELPGRFMITHIDKLNDYLIPQAKPMLKRLVPEMDTTTVEDIPHRIESSSIRVRANVMGFLTQHTNILPIYHSSVEIAGIYHIRPVQLELAAAYDFGKRRRDPDRLLYARYVTAAVRYNIPFDVPRDLRFYFGGGFALINAAKVQDDDVTQRISGGNLVSLGFEIPLWRYIALDINGGWLIEWDRMDLGGKENGFLTSLSIGIGAVVRLK